MLYTYGSLGLFDTLVDNPNESFSLETSTTTNWKSGGGKKRIMHSFLSQSLFSIDNFFLINGFLAAYMFLRETKGRNAMPSLLLIFSFYFRRVWRWIPTIMLVMLVSVGLTRYFVDG